jgi:hypothetical protein
MLEGKTVSALLAELEEQSQTYYRLYQLTVEPAPGTSWLDALANAPGAKFANVFVYGVRKIIPRSLVVVVPLRHPYVMGIDRALRYLCGPETFPYTPSPPTPSRSDVGRMSISYFDLPKPVRKVLHTDLVQNVEHLPTRSAAPAPSEPILNAVRLYISSPSYLLDPYAWGEEEGVLTRRRWFDKNSKLQRQEFLGMLSARLDKGLEKAPRAGFLGMFEGLSGMGMRGLDKLVESSGPSGERAPKCTTISTSTSTPGAQVMTAFSSSSTSTPHVLSLPVGFASSTSFASFTSTTNSPTASTQSSAPHHATVFSTTPSTTTTSAVTFATTPSPEQMQAARELALEKRCLFLAYCPQRLLDLLDLTSSDLPVTGNKSQSVFKDGDVRSSVLGGRLPECRVYC